MGKKTTTLTIDEFVLEQAKKKIFNISGEFEAFLRRRISQEDVQIDEPHQCEFCGKEGIKETAETVNQSTKGLTWLYPDEKWICNSCLTRKGHSVLK